MSYPEKKGCKGRNGKHIWRNKAECVSIANAPRNLGEHEFWCIRCNGRVADLEDYKKALAELGFTPEQILAIPLPSGRLFWWDD